MTKDDKRILTDFAYAVGLLLILVTSLLLAGCGVQPVVTQPGAQVLVEGKPQPCQPPKIEKPAWATDAAVGQPFDERTKAQGVEIKQREAYEVILEAALKGCTTPTSPQPTPTATPSTAPPAKPWYKSLFHLN